MRGNFVVVFEATSQRRSVAASLTCVCRPAALNFRFASTDAHRANLIILRNCRDLFPIIEDTFLLDPDGYTCPELVSMMGSIATDEGADVCLPYFYPLLDLVRHAAVAVDAVGSKALSPSEEQALSGRKKTQRPATPSHVCLRAAEPPTPPPPPF